MIDIEKLSEFDEHELVLRLYDKATNLRGFIAIHNTHAGPAVGGTRFCYYENEKETGFTEISEPKSVYAKQGYLTKGNKRYN